MLVRAQFICRVPAIYTKQLVRSLEKRSALSYTSAVTSLFVIVFALIDSYNIGSLYPFLMVRGSQEGIYRCKKQKYKKPSSVDVGALDRDEVCWLEKCRVCIPMVSNCKLKNR